MRFLANIDRRVIFLLIATSVIIPLLIKVKFVERPSPIVGRLYDKIESLPPGSKVLVACDYDPPSQPELQPMTNAMVRHLCERKAKIFFVTLWAPGPKMIEETIKEILQPEFPEYRYGEDYVNLGYKPGNEGAVAVALSDLKKLWTTDGPGANINEIPLTRPIRNLKSFDLIVSISSGFPGAKEWVQYGGDPAGVPVLAGLTAVQTPLNFPYYPRQILGLLGGIKGAAEYEAALQAGYPKYQDPKYVWEAQSRMGPQTFAHLVIIALIVVGNATFILERRRRR
jgi:hypothetical protein